MSLSGELLKYNYNESMRETENYNYLNVTQYWTSTLGKVEFTLIKSITDFMFST